MTHFYLLGYNFGKLSQQYQPVEFPLPTAVGSATLEQQKDFWKGNIAGWDTAEASNITFVKDELVSSNQEV